MIANIIYVQFKYFSFPAAFVDHIVKPCMNKKTYKKNLLDILHDLQTKIFEIQFHGAKLNYMYIYISMYIYIYYYSHNI